MSGSCGDVLETSIDVDHVNRSDWTALLEAINLGGGDDCHITQLE